MKVVVKKPFEEATVVEIENDYKVIREIIGGYLETVPMPTDSSVLIILDEEGKLKNLKANLYCEAYADILVGTCMFVSTKDSDFAGLNQKQINNVLEFCDENAMF